MVSVLQRTVQKSSSTGGMWDTIYGSHSADYEKCRLLGSVETFRRNLKLVFTVLSQRKETGYPHTVPLYQIRVHHVPKRQSSWLTERDGLSSVQLHFTVTLWQHPACVSVDVREIKSLRQCSSYLFRQWTYPTGLHFSARLYRQSTHFSSQCWTQYQVNYKRQINAEPLGLQFICDIFLLRCGVAISSSASLYLQTQQQNAEGRKCSVKQWFIRLLH